MNKILFQSASKKDILNYFQVHFKPSILTHNERLRNITLTERHLPAATSFSAERFETFVSVNSSFLPLSDTTEKYTVLL